MGSRNSRPRALRFYTTLRPDSPLQTIHDQRTLPKLRNDQPYCEIPACKVIELLKNHYAHPTTRNRNYA